MKWQTVLKGQDAKLPVFGRNTSPHQINNLGVYACI